MTLVVYTIPTKQLASTYAINQLPLPEHMVAARLNTESPVDTAATQAADEGKFMVESPVSTLKTMFSGRFNLQKKAQNLM